LRESRQGRVPAVGGFLRIARRWSGRFAFAFSCSLPTFSTVSDLTINLLAAFGVLFIGLSKAGFGGGLGMLTTPLCVVAFGAGGKPPSFAVGTILPLLCAGDVFSLYYYWRKWEQKNLKYLLPGVVAGVFVGVQLIGRFSPRQMNLAIGLLAVLFVLFQLVKEYVFRAEGAFAPNHAIGVPCGVGAGITSTFAHGAGPLVSVFLIPQKMPKEIYVGTTVLVFTWINWIKMPFFCIDRTLFDLPVFSGQAIITRETLRMSLKLMPLIPIGVWLGVWLNRRFSEEFFLKAVYVLTFLTGLQLVCDFDLARLFR
jgi:uncharacterized protein